MMNAVGDALSELLGELRVESGMYCTVEAAAPWGVGYPAGEAAAFHVVAEGECLLEVEGRPDAVRLAAGDFVVLPRGTAHVLRAGARRAPVEIGVVAARAGADGTVRLEGAGPRAAYLCGAFHFGARREHPLLTALPEVIHVRAERRGSLPWLETHLQAIACESRSGRPGAAMVIGRLSDVLLVQAVRAHLAELPEGATGWLGALRDPPLARALGLVHRHPERQWTVELLARQVGMSRSSFAERFTALVGQPPLGYLQAWRMYLAKGLLREGTSRLGSISRRVGYGSEAAFSAAFKRVTGLSPGAYRRGARSGELAAA